MSERRRGLIALGMALALGALFSWPIPRYFGSGIGSSAVNVAKDNVQKMIPGDHLQFLYHMWLAQDTFAGPTPLFYNLYEFNTGDDSERREIRPYYLPFSLFFTVGSLIAGQAFGWNLAILITLWLTCWFSWKLARRYHDDDGVAAMLAVLPLALPFSWITLMGGSPTGFGMMWTPVLLYGIDRWIAERRLSGAVLAGSAIFFAEWIDTHVFFFNGMIAPFWVGFTYLYRIGPRLPVRREWTGWLRASLGLLPFIALAGWKAWSVHRGLQSTAIASGRSEHEVLLFSHGLSSIVSGAGLARGVKTYVGGYALALLAGGLGWSFLRIRRRSDSNAAWVTVLLLLGIGGLFVLATGPRNPFGPRAWRALVRMVPPYGMIRQPDKVFCLLPALMVVAGALMVPGTTGGTKGRKWRVRLGCLAVLVPLVFDYQRRLDPTVCLLDDRQGAYQAVAEEARAAGREPRALALPLWPGDSHYSSIYQYYASLYRIRMVNGYRPTARRAYVEEIFTPFQSMNLGDPSDGQLDALRERGITHLLLHEDVFPEKVSSFPVGVTLANLLGHPRLRRLKRDGPVWSFAIREAEAIPASKSKAPSVPVWFPVRFWEWELSEWPRGEILEADDAVGGRFVRAAGPMAEPVPSQFIQTAGEVPMEWHVRVRGKGRFELFMRAGDEEFRADHRVSTSGWTWIRTPVPGIRRNAEQTAAIRVMEGSLDLDALLLTRKGWSPPGPGETRIVPAAAFFRAGYTLDDLFGVRFRPEYDPDTFVFYSRHLYLEPGAYRVSMEYETPAPEGLLLGSLRMRGGSGGSPVNEVKVYAGRPATLDFATPDSRFFYFGFRYSRNAGLVVRSVSFQRLGEEPVANSR